MGLELRPIDLYFMSPPSRGWTLRGRANFRSREAPLVDATQARHEWLTLAQAIEARGGTVVVLSPPSDELSGMPYAAECGHAVTASDGAPLFLLPRMASTHRRAEREHWAKLVTLMGFRAIDTGAGTWEAQGDVAEFDGATILFFGGRTDREGMEAAKKHIAGEIFPLEIREPAFHGNMALLPLAAVNRMLVCPDVLAEGGLQRLTARFGHDCLLFVTEDEIRCYGTNGLAIGDELLAPSIVPQRVSRLIEEQGMRVVLFPMRELCEKAGGASRCLVSYARVDPARIRIPEVNRLDALANSEDDR